MAETCVSSYIGKKTMTSLPRKCHEVSGNDRGDSETMTHGTVTVTNEVGSHERARISVASHALQY